METKENLKIQFYHAAIELRLQKEAEKLVKEAQEKLLARTPEIVAGVIVDVMGMAQMEDFREKVVFTIRKTPLTS